jgi:energy-coupling factor transporter transmembrane protein EcfT
MMILELMNLIYIDYLASKNNTFLHKLNFWWKLIGLVFVFTIILFYPNWDYLFTIYFFLLGIILLSRLSLSKLFPLTLNPLVFTGILLVSYQGLTLSILLQYIFRVLLASTSVILLLVTTPFPILFSFLSKFTPPIIVSAFFLTYRSVFILNTVFSNLQIGFFLRGGLKTKNPIRRLRNIGIMLGQLILLAIERSEQLAASLYVRGYRGRLRY